MAQVKVEVESTGHGEEKSYWAADTWLRGLFMLIFVAVWWVAEIVVLSIAVFQFGFLLFTRGSNEQLRSFGRQISDYIREISLFLTCATEDKPWPFKPWPKGGDKAPAKRSGKE